MKKNYCKRKKWLLAAGIICLMGAFCACQTEEPPVTDPTEQTETNGSTTTEETNTMEQVKIYDESTEVFDSFSDLKDNRRLFEDRAPCALSTLGYYKKDDGGAATYQIVKEKPNGVFEKLGNGLWAVIVAEEQVVPQQFGAKGNGTSDDITPLLRAAGYASQNNVTLVLPEADYSIGSPLTVGNVEILSQNAKISYHGLERNTAAVYVESNTNIRGTLNVWSVDNNLSNHGERCGLMFGKYDSETSVTHCYIENVIITGGSKHTNGVFITGDSYDITIDRIYIPEGTHINRGLLIHWGNAGSYIATQDPPTYTLKPGGTPTQHPHDIHIGVIECHGLKKFPGLGDGDSSAISICAGYDIYVDEIIISDSCRAVNLTGADVGFYWASEAEKDLRVRNIYINKITATEIHADALYLLGTAGYAPFAETYPELHIKEFYAEAAADNKNGRGLNLHATGLVEIEKLTLKGFQQRGISVAYGCQNVNIDELNLIDHSGYAIYCSTKEGKADNSNIKVQTLNITGSSIIDHAAIHAQNTDGLTVDTVRIDGVSFAHLVALYASSDTVRIGQIASNRALSSVFHAFETVTKENKVSVGSVPSEIPLTSGEPCEITVDN